ncbi:MAG: DNA mismatch repair protein MutT [Clostridiales bacterium]|nr:MAG: DNA mismatch repair protein MutT [Clostridiales bacterium]
MIDTSLCYLEKNGCYLMLHRIKKEKDVNRDKWIGVGGKFLPGETPEECARRETLEETGLLLEAPEYRGVVDFHCKGWPSERMHLFWADRFSGKLRDCEEGILEWVPVAAVAALPQWEGDKIFLKLLEERAPFFSLILTYEGDRLLSAVLNGEKIR